MKCLICGKQLLAGEHHYLSQGYGGCISHVYGPFNPSTGIIEVNQTPEGQGKRDKIRPRHDLIPLEFLDEIASIFEEGRRPRPGLPEGYGDSWKKGGSEFLRDCLNHASNHLFKYMNGDHSENQLAKVAWNVLAVRYHDLQKLKEDASPKT